MLRIAITAALVSTAMSVPAMANPCATAPSTLRELAGSAEPAKAEKALRLVSLGEKLCAAGGRGEATKKFAAAAKALDTNLAALPQPEISNQ
jgi:hypothetical protein